MTNESHAVPLKIEDRIFLIEVDSSIDTEALISSPQPQQDPSPGIPAGGTGVVAEEGVEASIEMAKAAIEGVAKELYGAVKKIPSPEKVTIEFGVKLAGETSIIPLITKASGDVTFKVAIDWQPKKSENQ